MKRICSVTAFVLIALAIIVTAIGGWPCISYLVFVIFENGIGNPHSGTGSVSNLPTEANGIREKSALAVEKEIKDVLAIAIGYSSFSTDLTVYTIPDMHINRSMNAMRFQWHKIRFYLYSGLWLRASELEARMSVQSDAPTTSHDRAFDAKCLYYRALFRLYTVVWNSVCFKSDRKSVISASELLAAMRFGATEYGCAAWLALSELDAKSPPLIPMTSFEKELAAMGRRNGTAYFSLLGNLLSEFHGEMFRGEESIMALESLLYGLVITESGGNPSAVSAKGAVGLTQMMPETAHDILSQAVENGMILPTWSTGNNYNIPSGENIDGALREPLFSLSLLVASLQLYGNENASGTFPGFLYWYNSGQSALADGQSKIIRFFLQSAHLPRSLAFFFSSELSPYPVTARYERSVVLTACALVLHLGKSGSGYPESLLHVLTGPLCEIRGF